MTEDKLFWLKYLPTEYFSLKNYVEKTSNRCNIFFVQKSIQLTLFSFSQIQDIEVISLISLFHHWFLCLKYHNSIKNIISVKNCVKYYVSHLLKRFIFTRETNIRTTPHDSLYITVIHSFFIKTILYEQKALILGKKINK